MKLLMISGDRLLWKAPQGPLHDLLEHYRDYWQRIDVIVSAGSSPASRQAFANVFVHSLPERRRQRAKAIARLGGRLLRRYEHELLVSHDYGLFANGRASRRLHQHSGVPWISEIHHVDGYPRFGDRSGPIRRTLARLYTRGVQDEVAAFRIVSKQVCRLLHGWGIDKEKTMLIPSVYLDREVFCPSPDQPRDIDLLFCGRLAPEKGIDLFCEVLLRVCRALPDLRVMVVGDGRQEARVAEAAQGLKNFQRVGWLPTTRALAETYRRSRLLVCTSYSEGNPRVVPEAMACGTPVISTPVGIVPEVVENGVNGFIVDWDPDLIASRVIHLLHDARRCRDLGERAREGWSGYEKAKTIRELAKAYQRFARA